MLELVTLIVFIVGGLFYLDFNFNSGKGFLCVQNICSNVCAKLCSKTKGE